MKKISILIVFFALGILQNAIAQEYQTEQELIESIIGKAKKDFVTDVITIPEESRSEFWDIYNDYEEKRKERARQRVQLVTDYVALYSEGINDSEGEFMNAVFKLQRETENNIKHYYKRIAKKVSPITAMQFYQVEEYLRSAIKLELYENLPFKVE